MRLDHLLSKEARGGSVERMQRLCRVEMMRCGGCVVVEAETSAAVGSKGLKEAGYLVTFQGLMRL